MATTTATTPSVASIAEELVNLCRAGRNLEAVEKFYAPTVVSVEPVAMQNMPAEMSGIQAIREKHTWWEQNNEVHSVEVNGPFLGRDQFAVQYVWDTTFKPSGQRKKGTEMALYTVKDGKIVREQFFYHMPGA
ncbi:MAG TPA: nuclear transport factor 2 family protein [Gemmatimonadales bacterium]